MKIFISFWSLMFIFSFGGNTNALFSFNKNKREAQRQNCAGSSCNQNNLGGGGGVFGGFGGFGGYGGGATQNCVGSACNQNNFHKKRREVLTEILEEAERNDVAVAERERREAQTQNCHGSSCNQNNLGGGVFTGYGGGVGFGGYGGGATQNCVGSQCNQNNHGRRKREIASAISALAEEALEVEEQEAEEQAAEAEAYRKKREAQQVQNCQGSACNQNNLGGGGFGAGVGVPFGFGGLGGGFGGGATQNCVGSSCNQNNGRRKREIVEKLLEEVDKITADELEAEQ
eukprot:GFUD01082184.1.p1 GENE.GFUD01082184.1~~GFUD01082184.1.p1  ORF type:complete len:287 (+),score=70.01 GFUD01082184.1:82-942(+)